MALRIAVIGCGTAGLAAAAFLTQDGHAVTLFERFDTPKPLGAGLLLQPTGLACLAQLGLSDKAHAYGARIDYLHGSNMSGREVFNLCYQTLGQHFYGLGIHRGALFSLLLSEVERLGIPLITGCDVAASQLAGGQREVLDAAGHSLGAYDLVIDASGARSVLRRHSRHALRSKPFAYGAVWGVCDDPGQVFGRHYLRQRYDGAHTMIGALAIGKRPEDGQDTIAFFWSLRTADYPLWRGAGLEPWRQKVLNYWPEMAPFIAQFKSLDDLSFAQYTDTILANWHEDRLVFIGDAGHCTSPQLGQGANMALIDALSLSRALRADGDINVALAAHNKQRRQHVRFYQFASRWLTPFFQSDSRAAAWLRDSSFGLMGKVPYLQTEMVRTLAGIKTGYFSHLNPGQWDSRYDLRASQPL